MNKELALLISSLMLLPCLIHMESNPVEVKASNSYPVHNLDTGLNYTTIQAAIDAPETLGGHVIFVEEGTFFEHIVLYKPLSLVGASRDAVIIDGNGTGTILTLTLDSVSSNVTGFGIKNGEYGIRIETESNIDASFTGHKIEHCYISNNHYGAVSLERAAGNTISNNIIENNTLFGIHLWTARSNTLVNNTILNNGYGIDFYGFSRGNMLRNNNMTANKYNFGIILREQSISFSNYRNEFMVNDVDNSNTVNGKPIYYLFNQSDKSIPSEAGYVFLQSCCNITVNSCNLSNNLQGVLLYNTNESTVVANHIENNAYGAYLTIFSTNNTLADNMLFNNVNGIYLGDFSRFTKMRNNSISSGQMNFGISPWNQYYLNASTLVNDVDASNTVDAKPIVYWIGEHDKQVPQNAGYVMLINSTNILVEGLSVSNNIQNICLLGSNNTVIDNNSVANSIYGIDAETYGWMERVNPPIFHTFSCFNTTVRHNTLVDNGVGIKLMSNSCIVEGNTLLRNPLGVFLRETDNSNVSRNCVYASNMSFAPIMPRELRIFYYPVDKSELSMELYQLLIGGMLITGNGNVICDNTVSDSWMGISLLNELYGGECGHETLVFHNNFIDNSPYQAIDGFGGNYWNSSYPSGGNYWSNHTRIDEKSGPYQNETGSDGIVDEPFLIPLVWPRPCFTMDNYPLVEPWLPAIRIDSPENKIYAINTGIALTFTVNEPTSWIGYSLNGQTNVTITGNTTLPVLSEGSHYMVVYANDTFGNMGMSIVYFTVDTTLPTISILSPGNKTYTTEDVPLNFTVSESTLWIGYSLDEQANTTITGNTTLTGLLNGMHSIVVYASDAAGNTGSSNTVYFTIDTPPTIIITSPENKTYDTADIPLTFIIDESVSWMGCSLDGQANMTIAGNATLPTLSDGWHYIVVYANDTVGNMGVSSTIHFAVDTTAPNITSITQIPLPNNVMPTDKVKVNATAIDNLGIKQVMLNYTYSNSTGAWSKVVSMTNIEGSIWNATIPMFSYGTNVTYIIIVEDNAGNTITSEELGYECEYQVIPEFPPSLILSLFMIATLLAITVHIRKRIAIR